MKLYFFALLSICFHNLDYFSLYNFYLMLFLLLFVFVLAITVTAVNLVGNLTDMLFKAFAIERVQELYTDPITLSLVFVRNVVLAAVLEELLFRGVLINAFEGKGVALTVLFSALLFSVMHCNFMQMPYAFVAGAILCLLVFITGSVFFSVAVHFAQNLVSFTFSVLAVTLDKSMYQTVSSITFFVFVAAALVGVLMGVIALKKHKLTVTSSPVIKKNASLPLLGIALYIGAAVAVAVMSI